MPLAEGSAVRLSYKFYASGDITPNAPAVSAADLGASGAQVLRNVQTGLKFARDSFQSNERRTDQQQADLRLGTKRPAGAINGELSPKTYADFFQALFRGTWAPAITLTETDLTSIAADAESGKFTFGGGDPVAKGLRVGMLFTLTNASTAGDDGVTYLITGFAGASNRDMTVFPAPLDMTADTSFTLTTTGQRLVLPSSGFVNRKCAVELYNTDIGVARLFTEQRVGSADIKMPATGDVTIDWTLMGRDMEIYSASENAKGAAPFFTSPAAETTTPVISAVNGVFLVNGAVEGVITSAELKIDRSPSGDPVVGNKNMLPEIFLGKAVVTGNITAMLQDDALIGNFANEDELSLILFLVTDDSATSPAMVFYLPRIKFTDSDVSDSGDGGQTVSLPFTALKYQGAAPGVDQTTIAIVDTELS